MVASVFDFYRDHSVRVHKALTAIAQRGCLVDTQLRGEVDQKTGEGYGRAKEYWERKKELQDKLNDIAGEEINVKSVTGKNAKVPKLLRSLGVTLYHREPTKDDSLKLYMQKYPEASEAIQLIIDIRELRTLEERYIRAQLEPDGYYRARFNTSATDTARISSTKNNYGRGGNLQNIPFRERDWFIPDPGMVYWACDASQIEARATAWISGDVGYIGDFLKQQENPDKYDIHLSATRKIFQDNSIQKNTYVPGFEEKGYKYRDIGKRVIHSCNYMATAYSLQRTVNTKFPGFPFTFHDAKRNESIFKSHRHGVVGWWGRVEQNLAKNRLIITPFGRRRWFLDRWDKEKRLVRTAVAHIPQSTTADHINRAIYLIEEEMERLRQAKKLHPKTHIKMQVHDEVNGQAHPDDLELVKEIVVNAMEMPMPLEWDGIPLIVPAEFESGETWKDCK